MRTGVELFRAHCLARLEKLRDKLMEPDWGMDPGKHEGRLMLVQADLTVILHNLGIECYVIDDLERAEQLERSS